MTGSTVPALATTNLGLRFGSLAVVDDVSISLPAGARHALIGPNGAGKTTLINLISGTLRPDSGAILLNGVDVTAYAPHRRVRSGLARTFQLTSLFPHMAPLEAVTLSVCERRGLTAGMWRTVGAHKDAVAEAYAILQSLGLAADCTRETRTLSHGRQRLVEIALALATQPKVLLMDEPTAGVGRSERATILDALDRLPPEVAVLFVEHDMSLVLRLATRVVVMVAGRVLTEGPPAEVAADRTVREVYMGSRRHG